MVNRRWVKWLPLGVLLLGLLILLAGFAYDVMFAGIPYQDPTPELAAQYAFHRSVAGTIRRVSGIVLGVGGIALVGPLLGSRSKKMK